MSLEQIARDIREGTFPKKSEATLREEAVLPLQEVIRDLIAKHQNCALPCACLRNPQAKDCASLANAVLVAVRERTIAECAKIAAERGWMTGRDIAEEIRSLAQTGVKR
jgi:hypothetical protein